MKVSVVEAGNLTAFSIRSFDREVLLLYRGL